MILDIGIVVFSYIIASVFWLVFVSGNADNIAFWRSRDILTVSVIYALVFWLLMALMGFYNADRLFRLKQKYKIIIIASTLTMICATGVLYLFRLQEFSRGVLACFYFLSTLSVCVKYFVMRTVSNQLRQKGRNLVHVLIVGTGGLARQFAEDVAAADKLGYRVMGYVGRNQPELGASVLCDFDGLDDYLHHHTADEVTVALDADEITYIYEIINLCEKNGVKYSILPFFNDALPKNPQFDTIGRCKLMRLRRNPLDNVGWAAIKRAFDIVAGSLGLIILSPLLLVLAIGVKLSSPGPVLFRQERVGLGGKTFTMLKFRSMKVNSLQDTAWTKDDDPRKTKFGSFIRKCSLDELPQLWNVFTGSMSLVGPRPELPYFVEQFRETIPLYMVKHQVRPGITGLAQVKGYRGDTSIEKRIECDIWYIENWTLWLDIKILFRTFFGGMFNKEKLYAEDEKQEITV